MSGTVAALTAATRLAVVVQVGLPETIRSMEVRLATATGRRETGFDSDPRIINISGNAVDLRSYSAFCACFIFANFAADHGWAAK